MKQKIQFQIPSPCHEDWNNMAGTEQGRFCISCQKEVIDFSVMTDKEILAHISTASSGICGRVQDDQLNRFIQATQERKHSFKYFWSVLIASFLISNKSSGQVNPPKDTTISVPVGTEMKRENQIRLGGLKATRHNEKAVLQISGKVVDENNMPVPAASVIIKGTAIGIATDTAGFFLLKADASLVKIELLISSVGFNSQSIEFKNPSQIKSMMVEDGVMKIGIADVLMKTQIMDGVVITVDPTRKGRMTVGLMSTIIRYTVLDSIKNILPGREIKVYPNPIAANSVFNIRLNVKEMGEYTMQFTDASGKIIAAQQLNIAAANQLLGFNSNLFSSHGIYFVSITSKQTMKSYTAKLLVQ